VEFVRLREKTCKVCRIRFMPTRSMQVVCSPACAFDYSRRQATKAEVVAALNERKTIKMKLEKLKTVRELLKEAQAAFNSYIRERDKALPCVSCGRFHTGAYDAGHYRSVGAAPSLRFDEDNCHRQCVPCNQHKSGNIHEYRIRLIHRIGIDEVERIEGPLPEVKWTKEAAREIKSLYKQKLKDLKNA
jgi:hypothetical protein